MSLLSNRITAVVAGSVLVVGIGATGAVAGDLIGSSDIRDGGVHQVDLGAGLQGRIENKATDRQVEGLKAQLAGYQSELSDLEDRVAALEGASATGADVNTNWVPGPGASIPAANTVVLDTRNTPDDPETGWNDSHTSYASIRNLDLPVSKGSVIEFTYQLAEGAQTGWGAPRVQIRVNGVTYSSAHQINPDYGQENADGTFTISVPATSMNDNSATQVPEGTITRATLAYDHQPTPGVVTFTNLVIDGQPISFQ